MGMSPRLLRPRASGFNPKSISGLAAWWDASDASTITTVSGVVSQWNDKSGNSLNATQTTANNRPSNSTETLNGRAVMTFADNDFFSFTGTARTDETLFCVGRANVAPSGAVRTNIFVGDNASGFGLSVVTKNDGATGTVEINLGGFTTGTTRAAFTIASGAPYGPGVLSCVRSSAAGGILRSDGTQRATCTTSNSFTLSRIGGVGTASPLYGYIAEILIYSRALTTSESQRVERYLGKKWGITVA